MRVRKLFREPESFLKGTSEPSKLASKRRFGGSEEFIEACSSSTS